VAPQDAATPVQAIGPALERCHLETAALSNSLRRIAALPPVDDDGDLPLGLFLLSDERDAVSVWEIRDAMLHDRLSPEFACVLRE
jgi:hypothetical protein